MAYITFQPRDYFNTLLWTGDGNSSRSLTGVNFQPDWTWIKRRDSAQAHSLTDAVRGATKSLRTDGTSAEDTNNASGYVSSFDADGFTVAKGTDPSRTNTSGATYASWNWLADNTSGSSNTDGSVTSTVSANTTSGFSIVTWTGTGSTATIGHGLSSTPKMILVKNRTLADNGWGIYHTSIGATKYLQFTGSPAGVGSTPWNDTEPTSSVFTVGTWPTTNQSGASMVAYCFNDVKGYSKFGGYTGNGNADGPFIYTGFRPAFVLTKSSSTDATGWLLQDNKRIGYNPRNNILQAHASSAETTSGFDIDFLSNGFKPRTTDSGHNTSGSTYIYMAFAESPLVTSNGLPATAR